MTLKQEDKLWKLLAPVREQLRAIDDLKEELSETKAANRELRDRYNAMKQSRSASTLKEKVTSQAATIEYLENELYEVEKRNSGMVEENLRLMDEIEKLKRRK